MKIKVRSTFISPFSLWYLQRPGLPWTILFRYSFPFYDAGRKRTAGYIHGSLC